MLDQIRFGRYQNILKVRLGNGEVSMRRLDTIDLRLLRVFIALVDANGFPGAQITLNLSPSTLSMHLADLEKRIGGRLCVCAGASRSG
jgi:Bacterial regulatory helix-turn-helix protein, lysR family